VEKREVPVRRIDDMDESPAAETFLFSFEQKSYEIDLSRANSKRFRAAMAPFVEKARPVTSPAKVTGRKKSSSAESPKTIRAWAAANGYEVSERGRIPLDVIEV
jgi:hypothetical protein